MRRSSTTSIPIIQPSPVHDLPQGGLHRLPGGADGTLRRTAPSPVRAAAGHGPLRPGGLGLVLLGLIAVHRRFVVITPSRFELVPGRLVLVLVLPGRFELFPGPRVLVSGGPGLAGSRGGLPAIGRVSRYIRGRSDSDGRLSRDLRKPGQHLSGRHPQRRPQQRRRPRHWPPVHQPRRHPGTGTGQRPRDRG